MQLTPQSVKTPESAYAVKEQHFAEQGVFILIFIEILLLTAALSLDSLAASVSFGLSKIKINLFQTAVISLICSIFLSVSLALSGAISEHLPIGVTKTGSFLILLTIGFLKLIEKAKDAPPKKMTAAETLMFAVSMSLDGLAAGFGAGLTAEDNIVTVCVTSCIITFITVCIGNLAGLKVTRQAPPIIQKIGGIAIIAVAVCKLI